VNIVELILFLLYCLISFEVSWQLFPYVGWIGVIILFPITFAGMFTTMRLIVLKLKRRPESQKSIR
jgi:hypothetical protein